MLVWSRCSYKKRQMIHNAKSGGILLVLTFSQFNVWPWVSRLGVRQVGAKVSCAIRNIIAKKRRLVSTADVLLCEHTSTGTDKC